MVTPKAHVSQRNSRWAINLMVTGPHWEIDYYIITGKELPFFIMFIVGKMIFLSNNLFQIVLLNDILEKL